MKKKILIVFGTRPEAIKLVPIIKKLKADDAFETQICITAQHREMLDSVLDSFSITADFDLSIMKSGQTLTYLTNEILRKMDFVFEKFMPDIILVHGDTTTAFAASLAAFYKGIPIGHIEAGLRSKNVFSPFPEEFNRRSISLMASLHFAPTENAMHNLILEGIDEDRIFVVGNTVIDTFLYDDSVTDNTLSQEKYILMTVHRREHSSKEIEDIFLAIKETAFQNPELKIIYPVHKNPRFFNAAHAILKGIKNVVLCEPLDVKIFHNLMKNCYFIVTDSGGIQEEGSFLGKPVLLLRENTERPEVVECGNCKIIGSEKSNVFNEIAVLLNDDNEYKKMSSKCTLFGDGHASDKIIKILKKVDIYKNSFS